MSLSFHFAKHPRAILEDSDAVMLLAVIERQGAATPDELVSVTGESTPHIMARLTALYANHLVEVEEDMVRMNLHGRMLLDRFRVGEVVIRELLAGVAPDEAREPITSLLRELRSESYVRYLATLRTQRVWRTLTKATARGREDEASMTEAKVALLMRALGDWAKTSSSPAAQVASAHLRQWAIELPERAEGPVDQFKTGVCLYYFLRPETADQEVMRKLDVHNLRSHVYWMPLRRLDEAQRDHSSTDWLRASCRSNLYTASDPLSTLAEVFAERYEALAYRLAEEEEQTTGTERPPADVLGVLFASADRQEFAGALGVSDAEAVSYLRDIVKNCERLLDASGRIAQQGGHAG